MSTASRTLADWLAYQRQLHARSIDLGLDRVRVVAERLGLTSTGCPTAIVGGTNGKGSVATLLATCLGAAGQHVGLFTSPHLVRYNERIVIGGKMVSDAALIEAFEAIESARVNQTLTFFEINALAALWLFRAAGVTTVVLEVGLGGRLDATNLVDADVAVVTSIGFDHRELLGDTLEAIGAEKAGIFRASRPVVLGSADCPQSIYARAHELGCPLHVAGRDFDWNIAADGSWSCRHSTQVLQALPAPGLAGIVQYRNAATALAAASLLPGVAPIEASHVARAMRSVRLAGRMQIVPGPVEWVLDVAHNEPAASVLVAELQRRAAPRRTIAILGMLGDKDIRAVVRTLDPLVDHWIFCDIADEPRGISAVMLRERAGSLRGETELAPGIAAGCARGRVIAQPGDRVLVLGSFHAVGPALEWLGLY
jgi:dihydrofolate synthase/folylpolyglutamate synthase